MEPCYGRDRDLIMNVYHYVPPGEFKLALRQARKYSFLIDEMTSDPDDMPATARYVLSEDGLSGYGVTMAGTLIGLFSRVKGRGDELVTNAKGDGAKLLDCFDGYLTTLYARHGFTEYDRKPNWQAGAPDVVYMRYW